MVKSAFKSPAKKVSIMLEASSEFVPSRELLIAVARALWRVDNDHDLPSTPEERDVAFHLERESRMKEAYALILHCRSQGVSIAI